MVCVSRSLTRHAWWLGAELVALAVLATLLVTAGRPPAPLSEGELRAQLAERVVAALEQASPTQHHDHGHAITAEQRTACVAEVFGVDPPGATRLTEVREVYAQYICASGVPGTVFALSSRSAGPVVLGLTDPPTVRVPHGQGYAAQVREMMPDQYEEQAFAGFLDQSVPDRLRPRYEAQVSGNLPN